MNYVETHNDDMQVNNPLGVASTVVSAFGLMFCVGAVALVLYMDSSKIQDKSYEPGDATVLFDKAHNGLTFVGQVIVFIVGGLVGGTLSLVGLFLGVFGLSRPEKLYSILGVVFSVSGPFILILYYVMNQVIQ